MLKYNAKEVVSFAIYIGPICGTIIGASYFLGGKAERLQRDMQDQRIDFEALKAETYTLPMAAEQALRMAIENPGMRVPDPRKPNEVLVVPGRPSAVDWSGP